MLTQKSLLSFSGKTILNTYRKHTPVIMIVDDEEMVTTTLATYLELETDYKILTFQAPAKALEYLNRTKVDLIISDFLMPEMDGLKFLAKAQEIYPEISCILLTGYADKENAVKAVNEVNLYHYVEKPWDNEHIRILIRNALDSKSLRTVLNEKVKELDMVLREREKLLEQNEMMREELLLAKNVQRSMLPKAFINSNLNIAAKYKPAYEVGGDFYDVVTLPDGKIAILLADVVGHGIQAALITGLLKSSFSSLRDKQATPREILIELNQILHRNLPVNLFAAGLVVIIDPRTWGCWLANGGIPHPFVLRAKSGQIERIPAAGLLLGVTDEFLFKPGEEFFVQLNSGDKLLLYSDGLSEVEGEDHVFFESQLCQKMKAVMTLPAKDILENLHEEAKAFSNKQHHWDDVTMLGIEVLPDSATTN